MIAFAIFEGFKEIHVYGVDMSQDEEYFGQRNGVEFWMGVCAGRGCTLYVPQASDLLGATHGVHPMCQSVDDERRGNREAHPHKQEPAISPGQMPVPHDYVDGKEEHRQHAHRDHDGTIRYSSCCGTRS